MEDELREKYSKTMLFVLGVLTKMEKDGDMIIDERAKLTDEGLNIYNELVEKEFIPSPIEVINCLRYLVKNGMAKLTEQGRTRKIIDNFQNKEISKNG